MMKEKDVYLALTDRVDAPGSKLIPQIWEMLVTAEDGKMLLELPASAEELAQRLGMDLDAVQKKLDEFVRKGVAYPGREKYRLPRTTTEFFESASHITYKTVGEQLLELWRQYRETEWMDELREAQRLGVPPGGRVFPFWEAIEDKSAILPQEDVKAMLEEAHKIAVVECPCRLVLKRCHHPVEVCLLLDRAAEVALGRDGAKQLSAEEALDLIRSGVKRGLILSGANRARVNNICQCCTDCCILFDPQLHYGLEVGLPSRYLSVVKEELCSGCQDCVDVCPLEAIDMQKAPGSKKLKAHIDPDKCYGCGVCVVNCAQEALVLQVVRPPEYLPQPG